MFCVRFLQVFRHCITIPDEGLKDPKAHAHAGISQYLYI